MSATPLRGSGPDDGLCVCECCDDPRCGDGRCAEVQAQQDIENDDGQQADLLRWS